MTSLSDLTDLEGNDQLPIMLAVKLLDLALCVLLFNKTGAWLCECPIGICTCLNMLYRASPNVRGNVGETA